MIMSASRLLNGIVYLPVMTLLLLAGCGSGGYSGGGGGSMSTPTVATELMWDAPPTSASVAIYHTVLYKFTYPNNNTGNPSAKIIVAAGGEVAAFLCASAMCGPGQPALDSNAAITTSGRLTTAPPGPVGTQAVYYVAIHGNIASSFTIQAVAN
jgi:hypothetical protein